MKTDFLNYMSMGSLFLFVFFANNEGQYHIMIAAKNMGHNYLT